MTSNRYWETMEEAADEIERLRALLLEASLSIPPLSNIELEVRLSAEFPYTPDETTAEEA